MEAKKTSAILIVDDEVEQTKSLKLSLRSKGYHAVTVANAYEALEELNRSDTYEIVLTDYAMPGLNGIQFLQQIRDRGKNVSVIMMTAYGEKSVLVDALRNRCDGFIEKPFTIDELIGEIEHVNRVNTALMQGKPENLEEFVPMMVHQLNNPLTAIVGNAELALLRSTTCDKTRTSLQRILDATTKIRQINKEILDLGRGMDQSDEIIDIATVVDHCLDSISSTCTLRGITISKKTTPGPVYISGNLFGIEQLVKNLLHNAIDAMTDSTAKQLTVTIAINHTDHEVLLSFADTGCGISEQEQQRIFTPYFTTKKGGTGLGLAVVERLVSALKGKLAVFSSVGSGTEFSLRFPLAQTMSGGASSPAARV